MNDKQATKLLRIMADASKDIQNIAKELKVIGKNIRKDDSAYLQGFSSLIDPLLNEEQIAKLSNLESDEELIYDQDDAVEFIY